MLLADYSVKDFTKLLASDAPAPGGGAAAALNGAIGIALTSMVAALTVGRAKYAEHADFVAELSQTAARLQADFLAAMEEDARAFNEVGAVFRMPKETDAEKGARKEAMQAALKICTKPPYRMMELSLEALLLTQSAIGKTNSSAASDLGVAALSLKAAVQGAWLNILINIGGIGDAAFAAEYRAKGEGILEKALPVADAVYEEIRMSL